MKIRQTGAGVPSNGSGDDEDSGTDGSADADKYELEQAEAADEAIDGAYTDEGFRRINQWLRSTRRGPEMRQPRRRRRRIEIRKVSATLYTSHSSSCEIRRTR